MVGSLPRGGGAAARDPKGARPVLSVVTTAFNSGAVIVPFLDEMRRVLAQVDATWEIVVVDDGSADDSVARCRAELGRDPRLTLVELSRNFGHEPALLEAMRQARGDLVFLIDSDLEEPPEALLSMLEAMRAEPDVDVIYGVQEKREGSLQHRALGALFYKVFNRLSGVAIPDDVLTIRLMTRRYVDALLMHGERTLALAGLCTLAGFEQRPLTVRKGYKGYTSYSFSKRMAVFIRYLMIFSTAPAVAIITVGLVTSALCALYGLYVLGVYLFTSNPVEGWTSLVLLIVFLNGILLMSIGICASYLMLIFLEVKGRPTAIVKAVSRGGDQTGLQRAIPEVRRVRA